MHKFTLYILAALLLTACGQKPTSEQEARPIEVRVVTVGSKADGQDRKSVV